MILACRTSGIRDICSRYEETSRLGAEGDNLSSLAGFGSKAETSLLPSGDDKTVFFGGDNESFPDGVGGIEEG